MGADAGTTLGDPVGNFTVMLPTAKLGILNNTVIMGVSGDVGMGQLYRDCIWKASKDGGPLLKAKITRPTSNGKSPKPSEKMQKQS